jgi:hypothetical protein
MQYIWREAMNHYVYVIDIMRDVSKGVDYLKGLDRHITSDHTFGGGEINGTITYGG